MKEYETRQDMLADLVRPNSTIAEIGVFAGDFSQWILDHLKPSKLHLVDPYTSTIGSMGSGNKDGYNMEFYELETLRGFVQSRFSNYNQVEFHREFSQNFFEKIQDGSLDAVYIDGDHSLEAVKSDLKAARYAVKEGGWIFGHDYMLHPTRGNPEIKHVVKEAVEDFCKEYGLVVHAVANDGLVSFAIQNLNKYKFCIVSLSDRPQLSNKTFQIFESYTKKHNYQLSLHTSSLCDDRHPSWSKIPAIQMALDNKDIDFIVWMDDDLVITDDNISLTHFIDLYDFRKSKAMIMVSSDIPTEPSTSMNCGMMFLKANHINLWGFLSLVWQFGDNVPILKDNFSWEQEAFNFLYRFTNREAFHIIPLPNFQAFTRFASYNKYTWKPGMFAAHLNCGNLEKKLEVYSLLKKVCPNLP